MNERFFKLPGERRDSIINGALHVFSRSTYKRASTDGIASAAGISKALIFHYFGSKKELYLYLYQYACDYVLREMSSMHDYQETDFFKILVDAQMAKIKIMAKHPDIMQFLVMAYYEEDSGVRPELGDKFTGVIADSSQRFLERADASKFKPGIETQQVLNIVLWMADGFMRSRTKEQLDDLEAVNEEYLQHMELLRQQFYKEEYL